MRRLSFCVVFKEIVFAEVICCPRKVVEMNTKTSLISASYKRGFPEVKLIYKKKTIGSYSTLPRNNGNDCYSLGEFDVIEKNGYK